MGGLRHHLSLDLDKNSNKLNNMFFQLPSPILNLWYGFFAAVVLMGGFVLNKLWSDNAFEKEKLLKFMSRWIIDWNDKLKLVFFYWKVVMSYEH
jgi:hypothetical protein